MLNRRIGPVEVRDLEPWHAEELAAYFQRSGAGLYGWLPWEHLESVESARDFLQRFADGRAGDSRRLYGLWLEGTLVGGTLFPTLNARAGTAELGVFLAEDVRGRGIVTQTVEAMIDWAFTDRGLRRLEWRCAPGNEPSQKIPRKLGFTHEGTLREVFKVRDTFHDLEVWSLLRREWREPGGARVVR